MYCLGKRLNKWYYYSEFHWSIFTFSKMWLLLRLTLSALDGAALGRVYEGP